MTKIRHRFIDHKINPATETLIIGTFNPDTEKNKADFFYGRTRNFLWTLIPVAWGEPSLKGKERNEKIQFIQRFKIDFIDLIAEVEVDEVSNYNDNYLDGRVSQWRDVPGEIEKLPNIKKVCLTRKSVADIPNMKSKIEEIKKYCEEKNIKFQLLTTTARFYRSDKQAEWSKFFKDDN